MGKIYVSRILLLGAVVIGLMMGISSCCCDDKKSQSPEQVKAQLKSMSSEVKNKSLEVTNKNNELAQLEISKGSGGSVSDDDIAKLKN